MITCNLVTEITKKYFCLQYFIRLRNLLIVFMRGQNGEEIKIF